jgi:predicted LPLAT superfamily acyltransferase
MGGPSSGSNHGARPTSWGQIAERGSVIGIRITLACYRLLGRRLTLPLIYAIVGYFFLTDSSGRRASLAYLRRIHGNPAGRRAVSTPPGLRESFRHYRSFALAIVDRLGIWCGADGDFEFAEHGTELIDDLTAAGRGSLILGAHLGSFDALRMLAKRSGNVVNVLMFTDNAPLINAVFKELSPEAEARMIAVEPDSVHSVFTIRECLERGEHVAILADRIEPAERGRSLAVPFLGDPVALPKAPAELAVLLGCPVFLVLALRDGPGRYHVFVESLAEPVRLPRRERARAVAELTTAYAQRLAHYCLTEPYQWFNFYDYWGDAAADRRRST